MQPRKMILAVLIGGPLLGMLMGIAADPEMIPGPEPTWRKLRPDVIFTQPQRYVDTGPQDLSPTWYLDRMPTWKRRALEQQIAEQQAFEELAYVPEIAELPPEPEARTELALTPATAPLGEAAAERDPAADAQSAVEPGRPAVIEITPPAASLDDSLGG